MHVFKKAVDIVGRSLEGHGKTFERGKVGAV